MDGMVLKRPSARSWANWFRLSSGVTLSDNWCVVTARKSFTRYREKKPIYFLVLKLWRSPILVRWERPSLEERRFAISAVAC